MASVAARRRILRAAHGTSDALPGDFVRLVSGQGLGIVINSGGYTLGERIASGEA